MAENIKLKKQVQNLEQELIKFSKDVWAKIDEVAELMLDPEKAKEEAKRAARIIEEGSKTKNQ